MKRRSVFLILLLLISCIDAAAQQRAWIIEDYDTVFFPDVSFIWHTDNPDELAASNFNFLKEGNHSVPFTYSLENSQVDQTGKAVLILWEDMASHGNGQFSFTKNALTAYFDQLTASESDRYMIASFNRKHVSDVQLLHAVTPGFLSNPDSIKACVSSFTPSKENFSQDPKSTDLYTAIREGIDILSLEPQSVKSVVVFTSGLAVNRPGAEDPGQVTILAQQKRIPIYVLEYVENSGSSPRTEAIANNTYGLHHKYQNSDDYGSILSSICSVMPKRAAGLDYRIEYTSSTSKGEEPVLLTLNVQGQDYTATFTPPSASVSDWIKSHKALFYAILSAVLILLALIVFFSARANKARRAEIQDAHRKAAMAEENAKKELEEFKNSEMEKKLAEKELEHIVFLQDLMYKKNLFPRLQCFCGEESFQYRIEKPQISIGRASDNDLVISDPTVSGHHAQIVFDGNSFEIQDCGSKNHVIVNGETISSAKLQNQDKVFLGQTSIIVYM